MPNAPLRNDPFDYGSHQVETPFHRYLSGGMDNGYSQLPKATDKLVDTTHDVEFEHPYYGPVRATYHCYSYKHYKNRFYSWILKSAVQLDPDAPRPKPYLGGDDRALGIGAQT